jgi:hypothetical protein
MDSNRSPKPDWRSCEIAYFPIIGNFVSEERAPGISLDNTGGCRRKT